MGLLNAPWQAAGRTRSSSLVGRNTQSTNEVAAESGVPEMCGLPPKKTNFRSVCLSTIHTAPASLSIGFLLSVSSDMSLSFLAPVAGLPTKRGSCAKSLRRWPANGLQAVSWTTSLFPPDGRIDAEVIICLHDQKTAFYLWHLDRIVSILE